MIVVTTPGFDDDAGFVAAPEPFERQTLVTELAVEALVVGVLPGFARVDVRGVDSLLAKPIEDCMADELGTVIGAQEPRRTVLGDQTREHLDHAPGAYGAGNVDRQALAGELIDHRQTLDLLAARAGVEHEVVGPDVIGTERRQGPRA